MVLQTLYLMILAACSSQDSTWQHHTLGDVQRVEMSAFSQSKMNLEKHNERHIRSQCPTISASRVTIEGKTMRLLEMRGTGFMRVNDVVATLLNGKQASVVCDSKSGTLRCPVVSEVQELYLGFSTSGVTAACVGAGYSLTGPL